MKCRVSVDGRLPTALGLSRSDLRAAAAAFAARSAARVGVLDYHLKDSALKTHAYTNGDADYLIIINNAPGAETVRLGGAYDAQIVFVTSADKRCEAVSDGAFSDALTVEPMSVTTLILS